MTSRVLTAAQMAALDRETIESHGVPGIVLMERAAEGVVSAVQSGPSGPVVVLVGPGNNGGDGSAIARMLHTAGRPVTIVLGAKPDRIRGDAAAQLQAARSMGVPVVDVESADAALRHATVLVDALLGIGQREAPRGLVLDALERCNTHAPHTWTVAVDVPTGVHSDTGEVWPAMRCAHRTVTFEHRKFAHVLQPAASACGVVTAHPIGIAPSLLGAAHATLVDPDYASSLWQQPMAAGHKGSAGHVAVVGGADRTPGASVLAACAALRGGAGLVTLVSSRAAHHAALAREPALMCEAREEATAATFERAGAAVLGPGLGLDRCAVHLAALTVEHVTGPVVLDADALTLVARGELRATDRCILTPHPAELARLINATTADVLADLHGAAREAHARTDAVVVAKHAGALILSDRCSVVAGTAPALATAGTGDVLAGLIGALALRHARHAAAALGAWAHQVAGRSLQTEASATTATATRLLDHLDVPFRMLESSP